MSRLEEVVISTSIGKSGDADEGGIRVWSPLSGQQYAGFCGNSSGKGGLAFIPARRRQAAATCASDYVVTAQVQKPLIKYWQWGRDEVLMRCAMPEKICSLCLTPRTGTYVIGGGASGRLYIWSVVTGKLHRVWEGHYRDVSVVEVSADGAMLVSASDDATIQLWSLADILDRTVPAASLNAIKPLRVWKGHSLAVTGLHLSSVSTAAGLRVLSCAMDQTLRIWDAHDARASVTFTCPDVLHCIAVDPEERCVYLGGGGGDVFLASLDLGGSLADWLRRDAKPQHRFRAHEAAVTCLAVSMGGLHLATGSVDKTVKVWDVATLQILQTFKGHQVRTSARS
jgi:pre-rRNA-processing protein IPI3